MTAVWSAPTGEQSFVWVIEPETSTVSRREVEVGKLSRTGVQIRTGLEVGELIATAGVHYLAEGQAVRPKTEQ